MNNEILDTGYDNLVEDKNDRIISFVIFLTKGTLLSILIFFSISFLMLLYIISPLTIGEANRFEIGFPFIYYKQFQMDSYLATSWNAKKLLADCFLTWLTTIVVCYNLKK